jgi:hypothetical protein
MAAAQLCHRETVPRSWLTAPAAELGEGTDAPIRATVSISDTFTCLSGLPQQRLLACCEAALGEPLEELQLAALKVLSDSQQANRLDLVVDHFPSLLPRPQEEVRRRSDEYLRVARTKIVAGRDPRRLAAFRLVAALGDLSSTELLQVGIADPLPEVREVVLDALARHVRTLANELREARALAGGTGFEKSPAQASTWMVFGLVVKQFASHQRTEFFDLLAAFGVHSIPLITGSILTQRDSTLAKAFLNWLRTTTVEGSLAILLAMLSDKSQAAQRAAVQVLRERRDEGFAVTFAAELAELSQERQRAALVVIGEALWVQFMLPAVPLLDPKSAQAVLRMFCLCQSPPTTLQEHLEAFLRHPQAQVQLAALDQLQALGYPGGFAVVLRLLGVAAAPVQMVVAGLVVQKDLPEKIALLTPLLGAADANLRRIAMREVSKGSFQRYMQRFDGMDPKARQVAARALAKIDDQMLDHLGEEIESLDAACRLKALQVVEFLDAAENLRGPLLELLGDPDRRVRATVIRIVELSGSVEGIKILLAALADPDRRVRANAIEAFEQFDDPSYVQLLTPFLRDPDNRVRANAAKALWNLGYTEALEVLLEMLVARNEAMRLSAAWALGEVGCAAAREALLQREPVERSERVRLKIREAYAMPLAPPEGNP